MTDQGLYGQELATTGENAIIKLAQSGASPEVLAKYMDLQERWATGRAAESYAEAVAAFQSKCPPIHKGRQVRIGGGAFAYAGFDDIMRVIGPILNECSLSVSFDTEPVEGGIKAVCWVRHGTHRESSSVVLPVPDMKVNDAQRTGAAFSYAKRYAIQNALNIVVTDEDTDAAGLGETITEEQRITLDEMFEGFPNPADERKRFLAWKGIDTLADLPASDYNHCATLVKNKLAKGGSR